MIPIIKPAVPAILLTRGAAAAQQLCEEYAAGAREFEFQSSIYAHGSVKELLRSSQRRKCAFCESCFDHTGYGDVEHFRPKAGYRQHAADELKQPGYYWLAYEWTNLYYSCQLCNQQFKRNHFPLKDGRRRARSHVHDLTREEPLLIDPAGQDPRKHIGFRQEYAFAINGSPAGERTIELLGLNREEIVEVRRKRLADTQCVVELHDLLLEKMAVKPIAELANRLASLKAMLTAGLADGGEFASMTRSVLGP